ncbi:MAG: HK97 family phage prohead protease [Clostridiales bacterium]|nr:HK97 family phage prohead protease [Clostridiales bacterium]
MRVMQLRSGEFKTREDSGEMTIEGYFAVFNSDYEMWEGASESIAPGAFTSSMGGDIRGLTNHDTTLVLGRTKAHTLELKEDTHGLWGRITINPKDSDAVNTYERVKRGDVDQCSIGFMIRSEETDFRDDGSIHWTITDVELFEVSVCTFPAYEETGVSARHRDAEELKKRASEAWKLKMKDRLHKNSTKED